MVQVQVARDCVSTRSFTSLGKQASRQLLLVVGFIAIELDLWGLLNKCNSVGTNTIAVSGLAHLCLS